MKLISASVALLGLPAALAAVAATYPNLTTPTQDATRASPEPLDLLPGASPLTTSRATAAYDIGILVEEVRQTQTPGIDDEQQQQEEEDESILQNHARLLHADLKRRAAKAKPIAKKPTASSSSGPSSAAPLPAGETAIAVITINEVPYTVTSLNGIEMIDGKTLTPHAPGALIGGEAVSEANHGVFVNGNHVNFSPAPTSSAPPSVSAAVSASSSSAAAAASSSNAAVSSQNVAGPAQPRMSGIAGMGAVVGAVVGVMIL